MFVAARIHSGLIHMTGNYVVIKVNYNGLFRQSLNGTKNIVDTTLINMPQGSKVSAEGLR